MNYPRFSNHLLAITEWTTKVEECEMKNSRDFPKMKRRTPIPFLQMMSRHEKREASDFRHLPFSL